MKNRNLVVSYPGFFVSEFRDDSLWLKFSGNFFHNIISFDHRDFLHDYFKEISAEPDIKSVVIHSAFHESGSDEYMRFFLMECPERDLGHFGFSGSMDRYDLHRFCNILARTVLDIVNMNKIVIHICGGDVLSLFIGIAMACDFKIVSSDTYFHNVFQEIGMLPNAGAAFFLSRLAGNSKAKELLLMKNKISAFEAFENGIADRIVDPNELEKAAMEISALFNQVPDQTKSGVKKLANYSLSGLKEYLEYETEEIIKLGHRENFRNQ